MLFMAIYNYAPEDRDRVIERTAELPEVTGVSLKGEWFDVTGHRVFRLFEADDEAHVAASVFQWTDLGLAEVVPVMETKKALKLLRRTAKTK
ncbi:Protein of unknown function [Desulfacinum hydrothermale DSM 13146]|uniref:DUF3303 domain-containing protein n=1 Tax=Desulfacinum hydrothermale DSM 13146 TaxID=1121390 RepID=A0A1W1XCA9_9BACT|nr:DUF3303 family protein [Desulfacinum hydrothermale]SMC21161.1 Protein of unknown function [Desulfacinum hydrothermale DSM 13146]